MVFASLELARRMEMAHAWRGVQYAQAQGLLHPESKAATEAIAGGHAIYAGAGSPVNRAVGLGLHGPVTGADRQRVERFYISPTFHSTGALCLFAWVGDEPAGGAAVIWHGGVAELARGSTRIAYRRRGVLAALLQAGLVAAREAGNDLAMVLTSPGSDSQRNVERAGFRLAYTQIQLVRRMSAGGTASAAGGAQS